MASQFDLEGSPQKVLIIQLRQLGDILLTTPCISMAKSIWPSAQIDFLCHRMGKLILAGHPDLSNLMTFDEKNSLQDQVKLLAQLRREGYDLVLDFMNNPRSAIAAFASGAPQRWGFESARRLFYTRTIPRGSTNEYIVDSKLKLFGSAAMNRPRPPLVLPWFSSDLPHWQGIAQVIPSWNAPAPRVILSPTHRREKRRWGFDRFAALADHLVRTRGCTVVWIWGPGEESIARHCAGLAKERTFVAPPTTFRQMAALIAHAEYFVSPSNGPSHVAVAVATPSYQLHGHTVLRAWCPMNQWHAGLDAPNRDLSQLSVEAVIAGIEAHWRQFPLPPRGQFEDWSEAVNARYLARASSAE
jgi:heptosyltransferase-2/heptosyltransferase-3